MRKSVHSLWDLCIRDPAGKIHVSFFCVYEFVIIASDPFYIESVTLNTSVQTSYESRSLNFLLACETTVGVKYAVFPRPVARNIFLKASQRDGNVIVS